MLITEELFITLLNKAITSSKLRMNYNFHDTLESGAQQMLNALQPGTEIPVHRHTSSVETQILLYGKVDAVFYDDNRSEINRYHLDHTTKNFGISVPIGQWHNIVPIEPSVIFAVKDGPYKPILEKDILNKI